MLPQVLTNRMCVSVGHCTASQTLEFGNYCLHFLFCIDFCVTLAFFPSTAENVALQRYVRWSVI